MHSLSVFSQKKRTNKTNMKKEKLISEGEGNPNKSGDRMCISLQRNPVDILLITSNLLKKF